MATGRAPTVVVDGQVVRRIPIRTHHLTGADDIVQVAERYGRAQAQAGDVLVVSETAVAVTQGRAIPEDQIRVGLLARLLWRFVHKSPHGVGLRRPSSMQCAINECGAWRIVLAAVIGSAGKMIGRRGDFYRVAGIQAATIDAAQTSPMQPDCVILGPLEPERVAADIAARLGCRAAVMDCNDIGGSWALGASQGLDRAWIEAAMAGNPLGQKDEQTPMAIVRVEGPARPSPDSVSNADGSMGQ
jgi:F420-0:gamma-glutamyl ligase